MKVLMIKISGLKKKDGYLYTFSLSEGRRKNYHFFYTVLTYFAMQKLVAPVGLEPTHLAAMDFESIVSTISPRSHIESLICRNLNGYFEIPHHPLFSTLFFKDIKKIILCKKELKKRTQSPKKYLQIQ